MTDCAGPGRPECFFCKGSKPCNRRSGQCKEREMPNILHEFYTLTKGMEYLVVIAYLFLFISFWRFLTYREKD